MLRKVEVLRTAFYDELKDELNMYSADDLVMCLGDINGQWVGMLMDMMGFLEGIA